MIRQDTKPGTHVVVRKIDGTLHTITKGKPYQIRGGPWVVDVAGASGPIALEKIDMRMTATNPEGKQ